MKKYLIIFLAFLLALIAPGAFAATTDFVANGDITVTSIAGTGMTANLLILNGSRTESWTHSGTVFSVINPDNTNRFQVGVPATQDGVRSIYVNNSSGEKVDCADNTTAGTSYVQVPSAAGTYTVHPSDGYCTGSGGTTSSSGATSGGGSTVAPTPVAPVPSVIAGCSPGAIYNSMTGVLCPTTPTVTTGCGAGAMYNSMTGVLCQTATSSATTGNPPASQIKFVRSVTSGSTGNDVKNLQQFLNSNGFLVATDGPGSPGKETTFFGALTKKAVIKFQIAKGIIKSSTDDGAGIVGPKTRAAINNFSR